MNITPDSTDLPDRSAVRMDKIVSPVEFDESIYEALIAQGLFKDGDITHYKSDPYMVFPLNKAYRKLSPEDLQKDKIIIYGQIYPIPKNI